MWKRTRGQGRESQEGERVGHQRRGRRVKEGRCICDKLVTDGLEGCDATRGEPGWEAPGCMVLDINEGERNRDISEVNHL